MDNLTHGLLGYALYAATAPSDLSRKERAGYAAAAVIGAEIPDIESFTTFLGDEAYLTWHRGFTHSFLFSPVMALLALGIVALFNRSFRWKKAYLLALGGVIIHILSDLSNSWGTGIWEPLDQGRYSLGILPIVDVVILLILLSAWLVRRFAARAEAFRWAWVAIGCYTALQGILAAVAVDRIPDGYDRVATSAQFIPTQFQIIVKRDDRFEYWRTTAFAPPVKEKTIVDDRRHPAVPRALEDPDAKAIARFAPFYGAAVNEENDAYRVTIYDPRFRLIRPSLLSQTVEVPKE
ncbi:inner membrane protein [Planifilum fimeticola]|uniref:Inner membrane protein n=1 Tax=Planifilum fimeticola TaxID=201975 RepID=A0A2T0LJH9_9BACL|nr:metal-dependent hydrolase [Planifilum fimeticola]PRX42663.1 inner membrane protein [Planifilum fimeticola]